MGMTTSTASGGVSVFGCSDESREAFKDPMSFPHIAGCAGGFQIPGTNGPAKIDAACGRNAGDTSNNPGGQACSIEDLCAEGWHVCLDRADVEKHSTTMGCDNAPGFFVTRQSQNANEACVTGVAVNNLVGCGTIGDVADPTTCLPLTRLFRDSECANYPPWQCADSGMEAVIVTKPGSANGGVLCCADGL